MVSFVDSIALKIFTAVGVPGRELGSAIETERCSYDCKNNKTNMCSNITPTPSTGETKIKTILLSLETFSQFCRLNYFLFGLKPFWFHFTNILMHAIVCVLFTRVCIIVAGLQDNFAIIAGILFAVHPVHTEAVSNVHLDIALICVKHLL